MRSRADLLLAAECLLALCWGRLLAFLPMKWWMRLCRLEIRETDPPVYVDRDQLKLIQKYVHGLARRVPFRSDCLPRGLAVVSLLGRRGWGSSLHLGARSSTGGTSVDGDALEAHAWVVCGDFVVTGGPGHRGYRTLVKLVRGAP